MVNLNRDYDDYKQNLLFVYILGERVSSLNNAQIYVKKSESKTSFSNRGNIICYV